MNDDWDGHERRAMSPVAIAEQLAGAAAPKPAVAIPNLVMVILAAALLILQGAALIQHSLVDSHIQGEAEKQAEFRQTIACFLFEITRPIEGTDRADVLARCGLIGTGTKPEGIR